MLSVNSPIDVSLRAAPAWRNVSRVPQLVEGEVHVWLVRIDEQLGSLLGTSLSQDEVERSNAFRFRNHQNQFVVARGALRFLLGQYLGRSAGAIEIANTELGKPYVSLERAHNVNFNLSHSDETAILGFSLTQELGIDIERINADVIDDGLLRQCLSDPENLRFEQTSVEDRVETFFDLWTRKEAYMKLLGDGLNIAPNILDLPPDRSSRHIIKSRDIYFTDMPDVVGFDSALATFEQPSIVRFYTLDASLLG